MILLDILLIYLLGVIIAWPCSYIIINHIIKINRGKKLYITPLICSWLTVVCSIWLVGVYFYEKFGDLEEEEE